MSRCLGELTRQTVKFTLAKVDFLRLHEAIIARKPIVEGDEAKGSEWIDEDDAPDLPTPDWAERLHAIPVTRGRPILDNVEEETTVAIDADIIERFRQGGAGWQSRINAALREWLDTH